MLFIHPDYPYLAATPDGLLGEDVVVEVKCPFTGRNEIIEPEPMFSFLETKASGTALKRSHSYFDQVQGQMFIAKRLPCDFVV